MKDKSHYNILYEGVEASSPETALSMMIYQIGEGSWHSRRTFVVTDSETGKDTLVKCENGRIKRGDNDE